MREIVMIPQEHISWLVDQKDSVLSVKEVRRKNLAIDWLLPTLLDFPHVGFRYHVVRRDLPRNLHILQPIILEELRKATETSMGLETDSWREVCLWKSMHTIIKTMFNRVLYDVPLCEDRGFLDSTDSFSSWLGSGAFIAGQLVPWPLRPFVGSFIAIPVYFHLKMSLRSLLPTVKKCMDDIQRGEAYEPNNFMTWWVAAFLNADVDNSVKTPQVIAERLLLLVSKAKRVA